MAIVTLARELIINYNGKFDKSNSMTREEIIELLERGGKYSNYYYSPTSSIEHTSKTEYYIKDNIVVSYIDSNLNSWSNYNTGKRITIWGNKVTITDDTKLSPNSQYGYDYSIISDCETFKYEYEYLGEQKIEDRKVIIVKLESNSGINKRIVKFAIDKETGVILERNDFSKVLFLTTSHIRNNRNVKLDIVTDEDVREPDLSKYEI